MKPDLIVRGPCHWRVGEGPQGVGFQWFAGEKGLPYLPLDKTFLNARGQAWTVLVVVGVRGSIGAVLLKVSLVLSPLSSSTAKKRNP